MRKSVFAGVFAGVCGLAAVIAAPATADSATEFYTNKTMTYIVGGGAAGSYDFYGRMVARYMEPALPNVTIVVKNVPAAGGIAGANAIYASRADGLTIGTSNTGLIYNQLAGNKAIKFDLTRVSWIGKAATDSRVVVTSEHSAFKTFDSMRNSATPIKFSIGGFGSSAATETIILARAFGLKVQVIPGYTGTEPEMAMRRGEIDANVGFLSSSDTFVHNGYGQFVLQIGGIPLPGVPQAAALADTREKQQLVALVASQAELSRFTFGPPNIAPDRLEFLRDAYRAALENPELKEQIAKTGRPVEPLYGDDVHKLIVAALDQSDETVSFIKENMTQN